MPRNIVRDFEHVQREMDQLFSKLKSTYDPQSRKTLLRKLCRLLSQADDLLDVNDRAAA